MWKILISVLVVCVLMPQFGYGQDAKAVLGNVAKAMGDVKSLQYTGSGSTYAVGQSPAPGTPWPRFNAKSFTRTINYDTVSMREEILRTQGDNPPRGGGGQPVMGEQRQIQLVSGTHAWNQMGETTTPNWAGPTASINSGLLRTVSLKPPWRTTLPPKQRRKVGRS